MSTLVSPVTFIGGIGPNVPTSTPAEIRVEIRSLHGTRPERLPHTTPPG
jgi:hypothetical protein